MWTFMTVFTWELWRGFRCELERAFVNQDEVAVVREQWGEITNWLFDAELSTDCHLPAHISGEAQILLWFIFSSSLFSPHNLPFDSPYTSIWGSNTLVIHVSFLFSPKSPLQLPQHLHLREHFLWLPFYVDIWQVWSHSVAFPREEKWQNHHILTSPFNIWTNFSNWESSP